MSGARVRVSHSPLRRPALALVRIGALLLVAAGPSSSPAPAAGQTRITVEWHSDANLEQQGAWRVHTVTSAGPVEIALDADGRGTSDRIQPSMSSDVVLLGAYADRCELGAQVNPPIRFVVTREAEGGIIQVRIDDGGETPLRHLSCRFGGAGATDTPIALFNTASGSYFFRARDLEPGVPRAVDQAKEAPRTRTFQLLRDEMRITLSPGGAKPGRPAPK